MSGYDPSKPKVYRLRASTGTPDLGLGDFDPQDPQVFALLRGYEMTFRRFIGSKVNATPQALADFYVESWALLEILHVTLPSGYFDLEHESAQREARQRFMAKGLIHGEPLADLADEVLALITDLRHHGNIAANFVLRLDATLRWLYSFNERLWYEDESFEHGRYSSAPIPFPHWAPEPVLPSLFLSERRAGESSAEDVARP